MTDTDECRSQAALFGLLGRVLEREVDEQLLSQLRGPIGEALADSGAPLSADVLTGSAGTVLAVLAEEFTGLLVQPGAVAPYASVFLNGAMSQEPCDRVMRWYADAGFAYRHVFSGEFPDHIGTMLGFVATLYDRQAAALEQDNLSAADDWRVRRERFLLEEVGTWAVGWCRCARKAAHHPFYAAMLDLTERVVWEELSLIAPARRLKELAQSNARTPAHFSASPEFRKASGL